MERGEAGSCCLWCGLYAYNSGINYRLKEHQGLKMCCKLELRKEGGILFIYIFLGGICQLHDLSLSLSRIHTLIHTHTHTHTHTLQQSAKSFAVYNKHQTDCVVAFCSLNDRRQRRHRDSSGDTEGSENGGDFDDVDMMDETIAAMVLTSLSVSPKSPTLNTQYRGVFNLATTKQHLFIKG